MRAYQARAAWLWVLVIALAAVGCGREHRESSIDLPDLNDQTRPYVTTSHTKVRAGPGTQFRAIGEIGPDAKVNVVGKDSDWVLIVSKKGNAPGYIELASVTPWSGEAVENGTETDSSDRAQAQKRITEVQGRYEALTDTQVRSGPGIHYPVVADISKGTKLNVVEESKGWYKVESKRGNKPGYVEASLTKPSKN